MERILLKIIFMSTPIKVGYLSSNSIHYVEERDEYFFEFNGRQNWLSCNKNQGIEVVYDQVYRQMYFLYDCKIIYSHHFYNFQDPLLLSQITKGYELKGFFR
jgi:hypothetical protein